VAIINNFIKTAQLISAGSHQNYYEFVDFMQWKNGGLSRLIQKFGKKRPTSPKKQEVEEEKKTAIHSSVPTAPTARMLMQP
jgi:hypothetical protein